MHANITLKETFVLLLVNGEEYKAEAAVYTHLNLNVNEFCWMTMLSCRYYELTITSEVFTFIKQKYANWDSAECKTKLHFFSIYFWLSFFFMCNLGAFKTL